MKKELYIYIYIYIYWRGTIWWPNPYCCKSWSKKPNTMNSCRVWIEESGLSKLNGILHGVREHTNKNKNHCTERSPRMIGLKLDLWIQVSAVKFLCMLQYFPLLFSLFFYEDFYTLYRPFFIIWVLHLSII